MIQTYIMIGILCALGGAVIFILVKYKKILKKKDSSLSKEHVVGRLFLGKLKAMREEGKNESPPELFRRLNKIIRSLFGELFDLKYEFAYVELNEELTKKGVAEEIRNDIIDYTMLISEAEYGGKPITEDKFSDIFKRSLEMVESITGFYEGGKPTGAAKPAMQKEAEAQAEIRKLPSEEEGSGEDDAIIEEPAEEPEQIQKAPEVQAKHDKFGAIDSVKAPDKIKAPPKEDEKIQRLRKLLLEAEQSISENNPESALGSYSEIRSLYDSLSNELKRTSYAETKRIISIYNYLLKEFKDLMSEKS
jgi:hypothetical protein